MAGLATEGSGSVNETAAKSENPAVRQFAEVAASNSLTGKTIGLFTPNAENRENRAAFEQAYGVTLPDTAAATRRMLQEIAAQQNVKSEAAPAAQSAELPGEAVDVPQTVQDTPAEIADVVPEMAAPGNVREATAAAAETDSYENAPLRETLGLRPEAPKTQREAEVQRALEGWRVTDKAAETISKNMPDRVDADRYAAAASPLYRLGRSGAATFAQALELAGSMSGTAADINYILSTDAGRTALEIAYTQGKGERILYAEKMAGLGGALGSESTSGRGEVYAKGTMWQESDPANQIISLNAAATGTDAVLRDVRQNDRSIRAYVDTETARIFFGDSAQDIFGTVLHEDYHWYNALDTEGARTLQEHALEYLAKSSGYDTNATSEAMADAELALLRQAVRGKELTLPVAVDVEDNKLKPMSTLDLTNLTAYALEQVERMGFYAQLYTYTSYANTHLDMARLAGRWDVWLADYTGKTPNVTFNYNAHQHTSKGSVPGISGNVDLNVTTLNYPKIIRKKGLTRLREGA